MTFDPAKYRPYPPLDLKNRLWPARTIKSAPTFCSVDLRDGNQALAEPMGPDAKREFFDLLVKIGFKEIEVGFPAASETDLAFIRQLIASGIPDDVTIMVLTPAREELIRQTFQSLSGVHRAIVHLYTSTSAVQRRVVFKLDRAGAKKLAQDGASWCRLEADKIDSEIILEYSPESFTATELDFAWDVVEGVLSTWGDQAIINLPSTVELSTPNIYADQIEWFAGRLPKNVVLSVHPHNDRGTAVAAAELALLAGADRVEGTLFGGGERTGNVDLVTIALNLYSQGIDPHLDLSDIDSARRVVERLTKIPVHPRHPYAGELVFTAFSGSHQDAIKKGLEAQKPGSLWDVPYLPIDPSDIGRHYRIRVTSQSGRAGIAYVLSHEHGYELPPRLQAEFAHIVQVVADDTGLELSPERLWQTFSDSYLALSGPVELRAKNRISESAGECHIEVALSLRGKEKTLTGVGRGPLEAFLATLNEELDIDLRILDYAEHALSAGASASAACYVEVTDGSRTLWGVGCDTSIVDASLAAVVSAANRLLGQ